MRRGMMCEVSFLSLARVGFSGGLMVVVWGVS